MKASFLKYFIFPVFFLLVFQGEGRGEVFSGFGKEKQVLTAAKNHVNNLPSEGLALVKLTDAKAIAAQTSSLPPNKMFELIKSYTIGDPSEIDFVGNMNSIQGFYVKAAVDARSAGKMDDVATFYAALEQVRKYRQLEPLKAHIDDVSDLWQDVDKLDLFLDDLASNENLLDLFLDAADDAARLKYAKAFEVAAQHGDDVRLNTDFLVDLGDHINEFPNLKIDLEDLDVFNAYKDFADDKVLSYEILSNVDGNLALLVAQKVQTSTSPNFWKYLTKGIYFEKDFLSPKFVDRFNPAGAPDEYTLLKNKAATEFNGINLDEYDMYSQVQLKLPNPVTLPSGRVLDYFVGDQVFIKWIKVNNIDVIDDMVIVEIKLSVGTVLTPPQNAGKAASSLIVRSLDKFPESSVTGLKLEGTIPMNDKWLKAYDSENGDVLTDIIKL